MKIPLFYLLTFFILLSSCSQANELEKSAPQKATATQNTPETEQKMNYNKLTTEETRVILNAGTERAFTGEYWSHHETGTYTCRQCNAALYKSSDKFKSDCGWPSFDDEIKDAVTRKADPDGRRIEIICRNCDGHLGHVFFGERMTKKDTRHCVNSMSIKFIAKDQDLPKVILPKNTKTAVFASGCFWGTEFFMQRVPGVIRTFPGYIGGHVDNPTYKEVCNKKTGHYEAVQVSYDPTIVSYTTLCRIFFETHDPSQVNGQGPDIGPQYRSAIFTSDEKEKKIVTEFFKTLEAQDTNVATVLLPEAKFWVAEIYHQDYYNKTQKRPYCHAYKQRFSTTELAALNSFAEKIESEAK